MTTKALVETCLNYPLKYDYVAYNDVREGMSKVIHSFNEFLKLSNRKDASTELLKAYMDIPVFNPGNPNESR